MTPRRALLLVAIAQPARARSATLAAIASNADYANRLYGSSNAVDPTTLRIVWPDLMPRKLRKTLRVECGQPRWQALFLGRFALSFHDRRGNDGDRGPAVGRRGWSCSCCGLPRRAY